MFTSMISTICPAGPPKPLGPFPPVPSRTLGFGNRLQIFRGSVGRMSDSPAPSEFTIEPATVRDVPTILGFIKELADYEKLAHEVLATEADLERTLFGERPAAEVLLGSLGDRPIAFALFFHNYSTFLGRPGLYLEDLYVRPEARGRGCGFALLRRLARVARERGCGRLEWWVLDWNESAIGFYRKLGAEPMSDWTVFRLTGPALDELAGE